MCVQEALCHCCAAHHTQPAGGHGRAAWTTDGTVDTGTAWAEAKMAHRIPAHVQSAQEAKGAHRARRSPWCLTPMALGSRQGSGAREPLPTSAGICRLGFTTTSPPALQALFSTRPRSLLPRPLAHTHPWPQHRCQALGQAGVSGHRCLASVPSASVTSVSTPSLSKAASLLLPSAHTVLAKSTCNQLQPKCLKTTQMVSPKVVITQQSQSQSSRFRQQPEVGRWHH